MVNYNNITDLTASTISRQSYKQIPRKIFIETDYHIQVWENIETIKDSDTGLHGYVLQNDDTDEIVISFRGTELPKTTTTKVKEKYLATPSQDARLAGAGGGAELENGYIVYNQKDVDYSETLKDVEEDIQGIVLGDSDYTKKDYRKTPYLGTPSQDAALLTGKAKFDSKDKTLTYDTKNQFTAAEQVVEKYVKKHGSDNIVFTGHSLGGGLAQYYAVKHDANAVTFAAADVFRLLSKEDQERALNGEFKDNIISYTYPNDVVGTFYKHSVGSVYYMKDPVETKGVGLATHGIKNYLEKDLYNKDGYFNSDYLFDEIIQGSLSMGGITKSPLELKNNGVGNFSIVIQSALMNALATDLKNSEEHLAITRKALIKFLDYYFADMSEIKNTFIGTAGIGAYDKLTIADVEDAFHEVVKMEDGIPMLLDLDEFEDLLATLKDLQKDTGEIAHHMEKMARDFERIDQILAQWFGIKN
ncbi:lipase family protein [Virgibacillus dokdonensis]|uniref:Lipase family protein n=5 Tax=Virgibacillus TaxID=84406 RepID=A0ABU7VD58_9BACI